LGIQKRTLNNLFDGSRLARLAEAEATEGSSAYTLVDLFVSVKTGIWGELNSGAPIDVYRRNLQRAYIEKMEALMKNPKDKSDVKAITRSMLKRLEKDIQNNISKQSNDLSIFHLEDILARIDAILNPIGNK